MEIDDPHQERLGSQLCQAPGQPQGQAGCAHGFDANHSALLDKIRSRLDGPAAQALSNEGAPGSNPHDADEHKVFVRRTRIRRFFSYVLRVLITGRLRPPVVGQREPIPQPRTDAV